MQSVNCTPHKRKMILCGYIGPQNIVWLAVHSDNQPAKHNILGLPLVAPGALGSDFLIHDLLARTQQKAYWIHVQANGVTKGQVDEGGKGMGPYRAKSLEQRFFESQCGGTSTLEIG